MSRCLMRCLAALPPLSAPRAGALWRPMQTTLSPLLTTTTTAATTTMTTTRLLSSTRPRWQDELVGESPSTAPAPTARATTQIKDFFGGSSQTGSQAPTSQNKTDISQRLVMKAFGQAPTIDTSALSDDPARHTRARAVATELEPHHLHVFAHRHNTHITFTNPKRNPIISMSCGNVGYRKCRRGSFDSAYSLTKYVLERLVNTNVRFDRLELVVRGFGPGREAAIKVLMSPEGKLFREKIIRVADATPIKFGGTRSRRARRL